MSDLFEHAAADRLKREAPLPRRCAPRSLDEFLGQEHILGPGALLRRAIEADRVTSLLLYGPPGTGKTALARLIAMRTSAAFEPLNAVTSGVKELRELIAAAKRRRIEDQRRTIVFVDEIHRFNRAQQDALLPDVENGNIVFIGATTENPYFSVVAPLLSRSQVFELRALGEADLGALLERALGFPPPGLERYAARLDAEARAHFARYAEGDARRALNALEIAWLTTAPEEGVIAITLEVAREAMQRKLLHYDRAGDAHYDAASAFIKSIRGSHPDSALYWMACMLESGEPARFVARRLVIAAAEEVGNADPMALAVAVAAFQASEFIGLPEARIPLAQAAVYLACAPKSNASYAAIDAASAAVRQGVAVAVPTHLRDASYAGAERLGHGAGYDYAHAGEEGYIPQEYGVPRGAFYTPSDRGREAEFAERLARFAARDAAAGIGARPPETPAEPPAD